MKREGYSLIESVIALSLLSILILAMLPVLSAASLQVKQLEEMRLQNQFLQNLITCVKQEAAIETDGGLLQPSLGLNDGETRELRYRNKSYKIRGVITENGIFWYEVTREDMDEPIRLWHKK